ncbi:hypothetical protein [Chryseotalea sanaruensis]|nr:hypothetical protein [Chryseotalea sanaruensis]
MNKRYAIGFLVLLVIIVGCYNLIQGILKTSNSVSSEYGEKFNPERASKGIPLIEEDWSVQELKNNYIIWGNDSPFLTTVKPIHYYKESQFLSDRIISERDVFHYETETEMAFRLSCEYSFETDSVVFTFIKYYKESYPPTISFKVNNFFADSIFYNWNINKYYHTGRDVSYAP